MGRVEVAFDGTLPLNHRIGDRNRCQSDKICGSSMIGAGRRALVPPPACMESTQIAVMEMIVPIILILSKITSEPKGILVDVIGNSCDDE